MTISAKLLLDSISPAGARLCTWELRYPKFIHAQLMTHRQFSRNAQSSRAMPTKKIIELVDEDPVQPLAWGINQPGMEANRNIEDPALISKLRDIWIDARNSAINHICMMEEVAGTKLHKQIINRLLEPWMHITVLVSSTFHSNFFFLRRSSHAQPEIRTLADMMWDLYSSSTPTQIKHGEWHLPFIKEEDIASCNREELRRVSVARCARVSYLTHDGSRDIQKDLNLFIRLRDNGHWSPFEHIATPLSNPNELHGNFKGWKQYRKIFEKECVKEVPYKE